MTPFQPTKSDVHLKFCTHHVQTECSFMKLQESAPCWPKLQHHLPNKLGFPILRYCWKPGVWLALVLFF